MKINIRLFTHACAVACIALTFGACATTQTSASRTSFAFKPTVQKPKNPQNVEVYISTGAQRLYVVEQGEVLLATPVSVGTAAKPTPHGNFRIYSKQAPRRRFSEPGAGYPLFFWMEFKPAYGIHWGFVKPYPTTMGCVRTPLHAMLAVFDMVPTGAKLNIASSQPWDNTVGKTLPVLDDSPLPNPPISYMLSPKAFEDARQGKLWNF